MNDNQQNISAKLQNFYEFMVKRLDLLHNTGIDCSNDYEKLLYHEKSFEINNLAFEFSEIFDDYIHKISDDYM